MSTSAMDPSQRWRYQHTENRNRNKSSLNDKVYPMRHCLMIGGGVMVVIDIGLFIGGIAVIASRMDMNVYGFAAMIAFSMLTMVFSCLAFICGYRAKPPRSVSYERTNSPHKVHSPKNPTIATHARSPRQPRSCPPVTRPVAPSRLPKEHVIWQRPAATYLPHTSSSDWSRNATCATSVDELEVEKTQRTKRYSRESDI